MAIFRNCFFMVFSLLLSLSGIAESILVRQYNDLRCEDGFEAFQTPVSWTRNENDLQWPSSSLPLNSVADEGVYQCCVEQQCSANKTVYIYPEVAEEEIQAELQSETVTVPLFEVGPKTLGIASFSLFYDSNHRCLFQNEMWNCENSSDHELHIRPVSLFISGTTVSVVLERVNPDFTGPVGLTASIGNLMDSTTNDEQPFMDYLEVGIRIQVEPFSTDEPRSTQDMSTPSEAPTAVSCDPRQMILTLQYTTEGACKNAKKERLLEALGEVVRLEVGSGSCITVINNATLTDCDNKQRRTLSLPLISSEKDRRTLLSTVNWYPLDTGIFAERVEFPEKVDPKDCLVKILKKLACVFGSLLLVCVIALVVTCCVCRLKDSRRNRVDNGGLDGDLESGQNQNQYEQPTLKRTLTPSDNGGVENLE